MDGMDKNKTFLIVGLGLLGGKYAQVLSQKGYRVTGITHSQSTLDYALEHAYICEGRNENFDDLVQNADYIIFGLYPTVLLEWVKQYGHLVRPGTLITDVSGVKRGVVEPVQQMLPEGVEFIASHPMAGRETSGVAHSAEVNFAPANFIITPTEKNTPEAIEWCRTLARTLGFARVAVQGEPEDGWQAVTLPDGRTGYLRADALAPLYTQPCEQDQEKLRAAIAQAAKRYLGTPYRWGGKTPAGIDCSGLCSMAYLLCGISIWRDSELKEGYPIHPAHVSDMRVGDLVYFPGHVALYLGNGEYIHSTARAGDNGVVINSFYPDSPLYRPDLPKQITAVGSYFARREAT